MRDVWAGYDAWLERPYQEQYEDEEFQAWVEENTTFETDCCGASIPADEAWEAIYKWCSFSGGYWSQPTLQSGDMIVLCPDCDMLAGLHAIEPVVYDGFDEEPLDFDDRDSECRW